MEERPTQHTNILQQILKEKYTSVPGVMNASLNQQQPIGSIRLL